jgi:methyl-accepting chemotaxis protein
MDADRNIVFDFFNKLKITHKLTLMLMVFLLGFAVIGAGYWFQQFRMAEVDREEIHAFELSMLDADISHDIFSAKTELSQFLLTLDQAYLEVYFDALEKANGSIDELTQRLEAEAHSEQAETEANRQLAQQIREAVNIYQATGDELLTTQLQIGLNHNNGLRGAAREAVHKLEALIEEVRVAAANNRSSKTKSALQLAATRLETAMLTMRRHEKDFIEREDPQYIDLLTQQAENFTSLLEQSSLSGEMKAQMSDLLAVYQDRFNKLASAMQTRKQLIVGLEDHQRQVDALLESLEQNVETLYAEAYETGEAVATQVNALFIVTMIVAATLAVLVAVLFSGSIRHSMNKLRQKISDMAQGDASITELMDRGEELNGLSTAFDALLVLRQAEADKLEQENEQINNSVIELMDAADRLSKRDLTVVAPVSEDITGNVSDALNLMARETARIMLDINQLAAQLEAAAGVVRQQGDKVADVAANERQVVAQALAKLEESAITMAEMAELAVSCDALGGNAAQSTKQALYSVRNTVQNINEIRNSVGETEKSIKRLGERSQEIGGIVEIIKDISERTHTLALNAGMQAVAAGEAGRGFSVVADEVQRLAETARESTDQIAALVQSIQAEASETMTIMNKTVSQVVEGSELAEKAGKRMRRTQRTTEDLVAAVEKIAERSKSQVLINEDLRVSTNALEQSTQATEQELREQTTQTENLFKYLSALVKSVRVFKLPDAA